MPDESLPESMERDKEDEVEGRKELLRGLEDMLSDGEVEEVLNRKCPLGREALLNPELVELMIVKREEISEAAEQMARELKLEKRQVPVLQVGWMCGIGERDGGWKRPVWIACFSKGSRRVYGSG